MACRFEDLLRAITVSRTDICNAMVFALDNAESATEVCSQPCQASGSSLPIIAAGRGCGACALR